MPQQGQSNNVLGDLPADAKARRDQIEEALAVLHGVLIDVDELSVRIDQAVHRTPLVSPVLDPARNRVQSMRAHLTALQADLGSYWRARQSRRWE